MSDQFKKSTEEMGPIANDSSFAKSQAAIDSSILMKSLPSLRSRIMETIDRLYWIFDDRGRTIALGWGAIASQKNRLK
jgi:hypothetical protein